MFGNLKQKLVGRLIKAKLKGMNLPKDQEDMIVTLVTENPELFQKIGEKIQQKTKQGMNQQAAMMQVFREHQAELQSLMGKAQAPK